MTKHLVMLAAGTIFFLPAAAQQNQFRRNSSMPQRYWLLGFGNSVQSMYDEAVSLVRYQNSGLTFSIGFVKQSENRYREISISPSFVKLKTNLSNDLRPMEVATTRIAMTCQVLKKYKQWNERTKLFIGGNAAFLFNLKRAPQLDNSQLVYDYALSIGPAVKLDRQVRWEKRNHALSFCLSIPLLSHIARPYYLNRIEFIDPKNDFLGDLFSNSRIILLHKFLRITSGVSVTRPLFSSNAIRIGYQWDFYRAKINNRVFAAEHLISFIFMSNY